LEVHGSDAEQPGTTSVVAEAGLDDDNKEDVESSDAAAEDARG